MYTILSLDLTILGFLGVIVNPKIIINNYQMLSWFPLVFLLEFPKWRRTFTEFRETDNHWGMNWAWFKDPAYHMCLAGIVVASWSLTQEVAEW